LLCYLQDVLKALTLSHDRKRLLFVNQTQHCIHSFDLQDGDTSSNSLGRTIGDRVYRNDRRNHFEADIIAGKYGEAGFSGK
jgi:hypothetical protein